MVDFTLFYGGFKNRTLVRWDADGDWEALDTEIDHAEGVATATVTEFSTVALVDDPDGGWSPTTQQRIQPEWPTLETFDDGDGWITAGDGEVEIGDGTASLETEWEAPDDDDDSGSTPPPGDGGDGDDDDSDESDDDSGDGDDSDESDDDSGTDCPGDDDSSSGDPGGDVNTVSDEEYDTEGMPNGDSGGTGDGCPDDDDSSSGDPGGDVNTVSDDEYDTEGMPNGDSGGTGDNDEDDDGDGSDPSPSPDPEPTEAELSRDLTLEDAEEITLKVRVTAATGSGDEGGEADLFVDAQPDREVLSLSDGESTDGWTTKELDLSAHAGEDVTVEARTEGDADLELEYVAILHDSSGSGFPDAVETMDLELPDSGSHLTGSSLDLDPSTADTSGDGLADHEQVDIDWTIVRDDGEWYLDAEVTDAIAHPGKADTSGNGLTDYEEVNVWGTDPFEYDTSGDGFSDYVDHDPLNDSTPPSIKLDDSDDYVDTISVEVTSSQPVEDVTVEGQYDPLGGGGPITRESEVTKESYERIGTDHVTTYSVDIYRHGWLDERPEEYYVNVTTEGGAAQSLHIVPQENRLVTGSVATTIPQPEGPVGGQPQQQPRGQIPRGTAGGAGAAAVSLKTLGIGVLLVGMGTIALYHDQQQAAERMNKDYVADVEPIAVPDSSGERYVIDDTELIVPDGEVHERDGVTRGYGTEYILETTDLTESELETAIEDGAHVTEDDSVVVVGDETIAIEDGVLDVHGGPLAIEHGTSAVVAEDTEGIPFTIPTIEPHEDDDEDGEFEMHHIDVGQADSTLLIAPSGETILIDTGRYHANGEEVIEYIDNLERDIDRIDHLVATHLHADHIGGHEKVIEHFETEGAGIGTTYDPGIPVSTKTSERYLDAVGEYGVDREVDLDDRHYFPLEDDALTANILNPPSGTIDMADDHHNNSYVISFRYDDFRYLTTGDIERKAEERLVDQRPGLLAADVYHAGHHASDTSSTQGFLTEVDPETAIVSSEYNSSYGHPDDAVLQRFANADIATYWTGVHGDIIVFADGRTTVIESENEFSTDAEQLLNEKPDDD